MAIINILGDFKCNNVSHLQIDNSMRNELSKGDINVLNFEAPIVSEDCKPIEKSGPNITNDKAAPAFLMATGFNLFSLANNHIYDFGEKGLLKTRKSFPEGLTIGAGNWKDAYRPAIIELSNIKLGFIALTHHEFVSFMNNPTSSMR